MSSSFLRFLVMKQTFKVIFHILKGDALRNLLLTRYFDQYPWSKKETAELRAKQPSNAGPGGKEKRKNVYKLLMCNFHKYTKFAL